VKRDLGILVLTFALANAVGGPAVVGASSQPRPAHAATAPEPPSSPVSAGDPWLLYQWFQEGKTTKDLFLARPDGTEVHPIVTDVDGEHRGGTWSPDGSEIAFTMFGAGTPDGSIWTANADGSGARLLFDGGDACVAVAWPAWSPDGTKVAMTCWPDYTGHSSVVSLDLASMAVTTVATLFLPEAMDHAPRWSPDGASIAFPIYEFDPADGSVNGSLVAIAPASGGSVSRLTTFDTFLSAPDWRPDASELVINSYDLGLISTTAMPSNLYAIKPDGTGLHQLTYGSTSGSMRITEPRPVADGRIVVSIATAVPGSLSVDCVRPGFVDVTGGEPVVWPGNCGANAELRPTR
jgi:Tol biopolymer transport system component